MATGGLAAFSNHRDHFNRLLAQGPAAKADLGVMIKALTVTDRSPVE